MRSLVVTLPHVGDVEKGQLYSADSLSTAPMVTWHPAGKPQDRFCIVMFRKDASGSSSRLLWLVADIPGPAPEDDFNIEPYCYGLAGNHSAIARGTEVVPYKPPSEASGPAELSLLLFEQSQTIAPLAPRLANVSTHDFSEVAFSVEHGLGLTQGEENINILPNLPTLNQLQAHPGEDFTSQAPVLTSKMSDSPERKLAHSRGGNMAIDASAPTTLTGALLRTARDQHSRGLIIYDASGQPKRLPYSELCEAACKLCRGMRASGFQPGHSALLQVPSLAEHFTIFWACLLCQVRPVAVAIPPNYEDSAHAVCLKIRNVWLLLEGPVIITAASHRSKVDLLRKMEGMASLRLLTFEELEGVDCSSCDIGVEDLVKPEEVAFYQLSSGSTGVPKCIQIAHRGVVAHILGEAQYCRIGSEDIHLSFLPVDHVVPILTVHCCDVYHGCEEVQADVAWIVSEPLRWLRLLASHRATRTWSPNFAFKLVADALRNNPEFDEHLDLSCCRYFMNAGEQVTIPVCEEFLEQTRRFGVQRSSMQPSFGMAEACTCMTYNNDFENSPASRLDRSTFVNLGPPVPGVEIRIADVNDKTVPEDVIGRFQIRGPVITPGYLKNEEANKDAFVGDGWFNTGDVGFIRHGCLHLTGREKEMIIIRGANFYCYEIEDSVSALPSVAPTYAAAVSAHDPATGSEGLAVFFVPRHHILNAEVEEHVEDVFRELSASAAREVRAGLIRHVGLTPSHVVPLTRKEFPKTTSGKIQRSQLAKQLRAGTFDERLSALAAMA